MAKCVVCNGTGYIDRVNYVGGPVQVVNCPKCEADAPVVIGVEVATGGAVHSDVLSAKPGGPVLDENYSATGGFPAPTEVDYNPATGVTSVRFPQPPADPRKYRSPANWDAPENPSPVVNTDLMENAIRATKKLITEEGVKAHARQAVMGGVFVRENVYRYDAAEHRPPESPVAVEIGTRPAAYYPDAAKKPMPGTKRDHNPVGWAVSSGDRHLATFASEELADEYLNFIRGPGR